MGDMADWVNDCLDCDPLHDYGGAISCRCCGYPDLHWGRTEKGRYVLVDRDGKVHDCPVKPLTSRKEAEK